jgi:hypothetical protein
MRAVANWRAAWCDELPIHAPTLAEVFGCDHATKDNLPITLADPSRFEASNIFSRRLEELSQGLPRASRFTSLSICWKDHLKFRSRGQMSAGRSPC